MNLKIINVSCFIMTQNLLNEKNIWKQKYLLYVAHIDIINVLSPGWFSEIRKLNSRQKPSPFRWKISKVVTQTDIRVRPVDSISLREIICFICNWSNKINMFIKFKQFDIWSSKRRWYVRDKLNCDLNFYIKM